MATGVLLKRINLTTPSPPSCRQLPTPPKTVTMATSSKKATTPTRLLPSPLASLFRKSSSSSAAATSGQQDACSCRKSPSPTRTPSSSTPSLPVVTSQKRAPKAAGMRDVIATRGDIDLQASDTRKKNIYRRPAGRPRALSNARSAAAETPLRHKGAARQLRMWNSEPEDIYSCSDDTSDREDDHDGDLDDDDVTGLEMRRQTLDSSKFDRKDDLPSNFRPRAMSMPAIANSILKKHGQVPYTAKHSRKQFCFKEEVDVYYFDKQEKPNGSKTKDLEKLKSESMIQSCGQSLENDFNEATVMLHNSSLGGASGSGGACQDRQKLGNSRERPVAMSDSTEGSSSNLIRKREVKIVPYVDSKGNTKQRLRIRVKADESCIKDRTSVKALSGGSAIIVILFRNEAKDGGSAILHQHVERLPLPVLIDPYRVKAHLHKDGELEIEAPVTEDIHDSYSK